MLYCIIDYGCVRRRHLDDQAAEGPCRQSVRKAHSLKGFFPMVFNVVAWLLMNLFCYFLFFIFFMRKTPYDGCYVKVVIVEVVIAAWAKLSNQ